ERCGRARCGRSRRPGSLAALAAPAGTSPERRLSRRPGFGECPPADDIEGTLVPREKLLKSAAVPVARRCQEILVAGCLLVQAPQRPPLLRRRLDGGPASRSR